MKLSRANHPRPNRRLLLPVFLRPRAIFRYLKDPSASWWPKLLFVLAIIYLVMPADFIPDIAPLIGWLDDVGVGTLATGFLLRAVAQEEKARAADNSHPKRNAETELAS